MLPRLTKPAQPRGSTQSALRRRKAKEAQPVVDGDLTPVWRIGRSMYIRGELIADIDVSIEGLFDGMITLQNRALFTGANSRVSADLFARTILVRGKVVGNLTAEDRVTLTATASVRGNIHAPRVTLAPGCSFSGNVIKSPLD